MRAFRGYGLHLRFSEANRTVLGKPGGEGESPAQKKLMRLSYDPEYHETREPCGNQGTTLG